MFWILMVLVRLDRIDAPDEMGPQHLRGESWLERSGNFEYDSLPPSTDVTSKRKGALSLFPSLPTVAAIFRRL